MQKRVSSNGHMRKSQSQHEFVLRQGDSFNLPAKCDFRLNVPFAQIAVPRSPPTKQDQFSCKVANKRLPAMPPLPGHNRSSGQRFSCSDNFPVVGLQSPPERASCRTFKKPVVAACPIFEVGDRSAQPDILSTLQQLPETIRREDFIQLYFENLRLKEDQALLSRKLRQNSTPKADRVRPVAPPNPFKTVDKENENPNRGAAPKQPSASPNCFVNYVTNNFNLNFVSPFKEHLKHHQKATPPRIPAAEKRPSDFARFFLKKRPAEEELQIKRRHISQSVASTPTDSPQTGLSSPSDKFTFESPSRLAEEGCGPARLDFTFSYRDS